MFQLADDISALGETRQLCMALAVIERVLVAKSLFADEGQHSSVNEIGSIVDDLWMMIAREDEMLSLIHI